MRGREICGLLSIAQVPGPRLRSAGTSRRVAKWWAPEWLKPTPLFSEEPQHRNGIDLRGVFPVAMRSSRNTLEGAARLAGRSGPGLGEISDAALVLWLDPRRKTEAAIGVLILQHRQSANRCRLSPECLSLAPCSLAQGQAAPRGAVAAIDQP